MTWLDTPLVCAGCERETWRPPLSAEPCTWCGHRLTAVAHGQLGFDLQDVPA